MTLNAEEVTETAVYGGARAYRALAGTRDSRVILLDAQGQRLWENRLDFAIRGLGVTPNGAAVVTADDNGNISLLDGTNGEPTWTVSGDDRANAAAISRDGATVVAATRNGTIVVLDAERREPARADDLRRDQRPLRSSATGAAPSSRPNSQIISATQATDGTFDIPEPDAWYIKWLPYVGIALAVLLAIGVILGLRRRPSGERAWRGYRQSGSPPGPGDLARPHLLPLPAADRHAAADLQLLSGHLRHLSRLYRLVARASRPAGSGSTSSAPWATTATSGPGSAISSS